MNAVINFEWHIRFDGSGMHVVLKGKEGRTQCNLYFVMNCPKSIPIFSQNWEILEWE
jgi:hypothetical protein